VSRVKQSAATVSVAEEETPTINRRTEIPVGRAWNWLPLLIILVILILIRVIHRGEIKITIMNMIKS
jgi:hypothetical protein